jgi:hypothetical protein
MAGMLLEAEGDMPGLERKLGIGKAEGAGDAWNVAPAKAMLGPLLKDADAARCGVAVCL